MCFIIPSHNKTRKNLTFIPNHIEAKNITSSMQPASNRLLQIA